MRFRLSGLVTVFSAFFVLAGIDASAAPLPGASAARTGTLGSLTAMPPVNPPRTKYIGDDGSPIYRNILLLERSPYLRQHAHNPVDWRPWGPEALAEAEARGIPVFISLGYATCHWCHVMEEESFDNAEIAATLNRDFIAIKVDRETLPQVDAQYMIATQLLQGNGGWPNNLFLTPKAEPILAFGYATPPAFHEALNQVSTDWQHPEGNAAMRDQAASVSEFVRLISLQRGAAEEIDNRVFDAATSALLETHDDFQGGFGGSPKFPNETMITYMLDRYERDGDQAALDSAVNTLRAIVAGGIHDQVGGGFHRYAVDPNWRTPHFEKMLYNQALLTQNLLQAHRLDGDPIFARAARRALDYVIRDMTAPGGAFFAAEDADSSISPGSEKEEGAFYSWTYDQLEGAVGAGGVESVRVALGLDQPPTIPAGAVAHFDPQARPDFISLDPVLERLRIARESRPKPLTDTKVIAGWNGLMIAALAEGSVILNEPRYLQAAERAAAFISQQMLGPDGSLARAYANGPLEQGTIRDYAWLGLALVTLSDVTGNDAYLAQAARLGEEMMTRFSDGPDTPLRFAQTPGPLGPSYDTLEGATPPGNASAIELFTGLANRLSDESTGALFERRADALLAAMSSVIVSAPQDNISATTAAAKHLVSQTGAVRQLGKGAATARFIPDGNTVRVALSFKHGWHANGDRPLSENLIPTVLSGPALGGIQYPQPKSVTLGFQTEPLLVFEGEVEIAAQNVGGAREAELMIQLCNDDYCLPPENHSFRFAPTN